MPMPVLGSFAQRLYDKLSSMAWDEANQNYSLAVFLGALGDSLFQEVEDYSSDTDDGKVGWSMMVDVDRAPDKALPWLAQLVGVELTGGLTPSQQRQQISDLSNWKRGTVAALRDAPKPYLTGAQTVVFRERFGGPGKLTVITYTSQTPDSSKVLAALLRQKPAGITLTYTVLAGQDYQSLLTNHPTYSNVFSTYLTYQGIVTDQPGT